MHYFHSHVIVDGSPNDVDRGVRTQRIDEIKRKDLAGPVFECCRFLGFRALERHARPIVGIILSCFPKTELLQTRRRGQQCRDEIVGSWVQAC